MLVTTRLSLKPKNMEANLFLKYSIRALGYQITFPSVDMQWHAPNDEILPDFRIASSSEPDAMEESAEIIVDLDVLSDSKNR